MQPLNRHTVLSLIVTCGFSIGCSDRPAEPAVVGSGAGSPAVATGAAAAGAAASSAVPPKNGAGGVASNASSGANSRGGSGGSSAVPASSVVAAGGTGGKDASVNKAGAGGTGGKAGAGGVGGKIGAGGTGGKSGPVSTDVEPPPPITNGCNGYATRYWDCCKPHCAWADNTPNKSPAPTCGKDNQVVDSNTASGCNNGGGYQCGSMVPWKVGERLSYGYAAVHTNDMSGGCGRCYQLDFTGTAAKGNAASAAALKGKVMIVQTVNVGSDVSAGQFDLLIPGGGLGQFNACSTQWGIEASELGAKNGGLRASCGGSPQEAKACVLDKCKSVFGSRNLTDMQAGCEWFANWFEAADNPDFVYKEVDCPAALTTKSHLKPNAIQNQCGG